MTSLKVSLPELKFALARTQLPRDLGNDLILRTAILDDTEPLAQFCGRVFGRDQFDHIAADFSRVYVASHPAVGSSNVFIVEDTHARKIVSTMLLIPQTWTYAGIPFGVGRPEMVATDPDYRRRGLVRAQFDTLHAISAAMGHSVQAITGIQYFYRQFEYEYAIDLGGGKMLTFDAIPARKENENEPYRLRAMTHADIPFAQLLYARDCARSLIACPRAETELRYHLDVSPDSYTQCPYSIIENADGRAVGYVATMRELRMGEWYGAFEFTVSEGQSFRAVIPSVLRALATMAHEEGKQQNKSVKGVFLNLGREHPAYDAIHDLPARMRPVYGWYIRVADPIAFINHIAPALEANLARSAFAGHSGEIKINEFHGGTRLILEQGRVRAETWHPLDHEMDASFPPRVFWQMIFGRHTLAELRDVLPDVWAKDETWFLLDALFPKHHSFVIPVG